MPKRELKDSDFLVTMRRRYKLANESDAAQDEREREDIAFEDGDQWPTTIKLARQGQQPTAGMPAVPSRPTLVINKVREPVRQILNQERQADIGIEITAADDFGDLGVTPDETEITLREGLVRRIQRESHAADARTWAFKRAVIAGRGYYIVRTRYLPGMTSDQEVYIDRIYNQNGVKLDPTHTRPDGSDAEWGFVGTWISWDRFTGEYPKDADGDTNVLADYDAQDFIGLTESYPDWYKDEGGEKAVRIVDYWYTEWTSTEAATLSDGRTVPAHQVPEGVKPIETRTVIEKVIQFCKVAGGLLELERTQESGPDMPIVKVIGDEVLPYDEQRRYNGVVRPSRDACMGFNYMISKQVEMVGLTPIPLLMLDPEAIDGYEEIYKTINVRAHPYGPYRSFDDDGRPLNPPTRMPSDPNVFPVAQSIGLFDAAIKSTTAVPDSTLGNVDPSLKSGKAIDAVVANASLSTSNYLDNLARAIECEGRIINNKLYPIYGARPGRLVRVLTGEGDQQTMGIGDPQDAQLRQKAEKVAKLTKDARFNLAVKVTKNYPTRRLQENTALGQLIAAEPQLMTWFGDLYFKSSDIPSRMQFADRAKLMLAPPIQQMLAKQEQGQTFDPQAQAQIAQLTQQLQQLQQIAQQQGQELQTKQMDNHAKMQIEQMKTQAEQQMKQAEFQRDITLQQMQDATTIAVAEINARVQGVTSANELQHEQLALHTEQAHEIGMAGLDQAHQRDMASQQADQAMNQQMQQQAATAVQETSPNV